MATQIHGRKIFKTNNIAVVIILLIATALTACGCGGGGGGAGVGNRGGDDVAPVISMSSPTNGGRISDVDFRAETFNIQLSYSDTTPMIYSTFKATMKMDTGAAADISSYFGQVDASTVKSANLYQYTRTLFDLPTNDTSRTITISVQLNDSAGNTGRSTFTITVYPYGPAVPPVPPPT